MKFLILYAGVLLFPLHVYSCTGILLKASDRSTVNGRTVEFGAPLDMSLAVIPRNYTFTQKSPLGDAMSYKSRYAAVGIFCFDNPLLMDGMNEKGLSVGAFYFPGYARYSKLTTSNKNQALSPVDFSNWILTSFASIEAVKKAVRCVTISDDILIPGVVLKDWGNAQPPLHYIVYDKTGRSIVIEPSGETLNVYENPISTITNSPSFDWHMTNLNNYINLNPNNINTTHLGHLPLKSFGQGSGMLGLPGDFTPPSRFIRAAFFSTLSVTTHNSNEAVDQAFHILNQFDIPKGVVRGKKRSKTEFDFTMLTSVKDTKNLEYSYRTYKDQGIKLIKLSNFNFTAANIKTMKIEGSSKKTDVSSRLK